MYKKKLRIEPLMDLDLPRQLDLIFSTSETKKKILNTFKTYQFF